MAKIHRHCCLGSQRIQKTRWPQMTDNILFHLQSTLFSVLLRMEGNQHSIDLSVKLSGHSRITTKQVVYVYHPAQYLALPIRVRFFNFKLKINGTN